jgi:hypothetical protein
MSVKNKITYKIPPNNQPTITTSPGVDSVQFKKFTGSDSFDVREEMLKDSTDLLDDVEVTTVAQECVKLKAKEDEIAKLEEQLKTKKAEADDISSRVIPELLAEQGLSEIKLADGSKVSVKKEYRCTIPKDETRRELCYKWLRDQKLEDIIKNNVFVTFGKGEDDKAKQLLDLAAANGFEPQQKSDVSWQTLTALFRERIESGLDMPSDVFSTWVKDKTKITRK